MTQEAQVVQAVEAKPARVMSPAAKAALEASRARYELAESILSVMETLVKEGDFPEDTLNDLTARGMNRLAAEKKRKADEAEFRRLNNQRGVGLALHREKTNAALGLMEKLKAAGLSPEDIMSGKIDPAAIAKVLACNATEPESSIEPESPESEYDEDGNQIA